MNDTLLIKKSYLKEIAPLAKTYRKGDIHDEIVKIKEWLMLWQLNMNDVDIFLDIQNKTFDEATENVVIEFQKFIGLAATGIVDAQSWQQMVSIMQKAFSLDYYNHKDLPDRCTYFALKHLQFRSSELMKDNEGPWVRSYMNGTDGPLSYWCQGFVCTILDQTFSSFGERFDTYYANTVSCQEMREHAKNRGLLVAHESLVDRTYIPKRGDLVLFIERKSKVGHHVEVIYDLLDTDTGEMLTIGGNTNFIGARDGVGTFLVNRNFITGSQLNDVEIVRMLATNIKNQEPTTQLNNATKLIQSYPDHLVGYEDNHIVFKDGTKMLFCDHKEKSTLTLLNNADINDQFVYPYRKGTSLHPALAYDDPGRVTNDAFFQKMYGSSEQEVRSNLVEIIWCPKLSGMKIEVTCVNGVHEKLKSIGEEIDKLPELKPYVDELGGTFNWRYIHGTHRLSLHSYGIAIDINVKKSNYWQWDSGMTNELVNLPYKNQIPEVIVDIFEKHGFIWGGKWYHYDTMHFEYRPELL